MAYLRLWIDESDLPEWNAKFKKAGIVLGVKSGIFKKSASELMDMGYTRGQLDHFRKNYELEIIIDCREVSIKAGDKEGIRRKNIVYNYTRMIELGLTPSTRYKKVESFSNKIKSNTLLEIKAMITALAALLDN